ncbi:hypothetical protein CTheo_8390 [Ceratobasidium theobromae]|uniref:Ricin B lectin domain-containing protein n=1 Tax=Ceratobasidium theobromae TaxID=1582974 RepID=A0A5N5Q9Q9_9AGAM|nr:hypothetical protein CTheo_8390 [Ceratobasidium theobromae]
MANIESGTYRIVNLARRKAIRVPDERTDMITRGVHNKLISIINHQWFVQRTTEGSYRFKNCRYGGYLVVDSTECNSVVYHGRLASVNSVWKIIPNVRGGYLIRLEAADRVLDLHDRGEVYIWPQNDAEPQKLWALERLGGESRAAATDIDTVWEIVDQTWLRPHDLNQLSASQLQTMLAERDQQIAQQAERLTNLERQLGQKDRGLTEARMQSLRDSEVITGLRKDIKERDRRVAQQAERLADLERQLEQKNRDSAEARAQRPGDSKDANGGTGSIDGRSLDSSAEIPRRRGRFYF